MEKTFFTSLWQCQPLSQAFTLLCSVLVLPVPEDSCPACNATATQLFRFWAAESWANLWMFRSGQICLISLDQMHKDVIPPKSTNLNCHASSAPPFLGDMVALSLFGLLPWDKPRSTRSRDWGPFPPEACGWEEKLPLAAGEHPEQKGLM